MERPMCPLCENRHFAREPHQFDPTPVGRAREVLAKKPPSVTLTEEQLTAVKLIATSKPKFDRVAYQREYMRKRRADAKARKVGRNRSADVAG